MNKSIWEKIIENVKAVFFTLWLFIIFQFLSLYSEVRDIDMYFKLTIAGIVLLFGELALSWYSAKKRKKDWDLVNISNRTWREHFSNHAMLPVLLFVLTASFIWVNNIAIFKQLFIFIISAAYLPLFINIHATYRNQLKIRRETYYIFDFIRVIIFFLGVDYILAFSWFSEISPVVKPLMVTAMTFILLFLMVWLSKQLSYVTYLYMFLSSILIGTVFFLVTTMFVLNPLMLTIIVTLAFFLILTYWHHKLEGTFDWHVFSEYLLVTILLIIILIGLSR